MRARLRLKSSTPSYSRIPRAACMRRNASRTKQLYLGLRQDMGRNKNSEVGWETKPLTFSRFTKTYLF